MSYPISNQFRLSQNTPGDGQFSVPIGYKTNNIPQMPDNYTIINNQYQNQTINSSYPRNITSGNYGQRNTTGPQQQQLIQLQRPYYQKKHNNDRESKSNYQNNNNSKINQQSSIKKLCCSPIVLIIFGVIAIIGITLGLIFGLKNKSGDQIIINNQSTTSHYDENNYPEKNHNKLYLRNFQFSHNFKYNYQ